MEKIGFTAEAIRQQWSALDHDTWRVSSAIEQAYFAFYRIDFEHYFNAVTHHFGFVEAGDFYIATHYFDNAAQTQGTVFILHGYFDHVGLYRHVIDCYIRQGFSVVAFDLPGHGLSSGEPAAIDDFAHYTQTFSSVLTHFKQQAPLPFSVCGQSTGGAVLLDYLLTQQPENNTFKSVVLFAPLIRPAHWLQVNGLYVLARLFFIKRVRRVFLRNSHDKGFLDFLEKDDPLQCRTISVKWVKALKDWIDDMHARQPIHAPLLIIQGKSDATVDWRFNIPFIEHLFPNAVVHYINAARHHLANESAVLRTTAFNVLEQWLRR